MGCSPFRRKVNNPTIVNKIDENLLKKGETNTLKNINSENIKLERGLFIQGFCGDPFEKYDIISKLGEGSYGKVIKVKEKENEVLRAMKIIKKRSRYRNLEEEKRIKKEIHILRKLDHPNILKIFEFYNNKNEFFIISELCEGGELFDRIVKLEKFTEKMASNVMKQILSAVQFCHKNQIIHRDLKPENILIESDDTESENNDYFIVKIIDFGTAEIFKKNKLLSKQIGTPYYIAPEVLNNQYNEKCDIWSCGVIMYILLSGCPPFYEKNDQEIYFAIRNGRYSFRHKVWNNVSDEAKNLIKKLLDLDFNTRPTAEEAIRDPWFSKFEDRNNSPTNNQNNLNSSKFIKCKSQDHLNQGMLDNSFISEKEANINENNQNKSKNDNDNNKETLFTDEIRLKEALFNLKHFRVERKLQLASLYFMVHTLLVKQDITVIRDIFYNFDIDKDGRLTKEEIEKGCKTAKYMEFSDAEFEKIMQIVDIDGNGYIEYQEFIAAAYSKKKILTDFNLKKAFDMFDKDKSGKISSDELKSVLGFGNEENGEVWVKIISEIDSDGDGEISFEEFKTMMYNLISSA